MGHCSCNAHGIVVVNIQGGKHQYLFYYYYFVLVYFQHYQSKVEHKKDREFVKNLHRQDFSGENLTQKIKNKQQMPYRDKTAKI